MMIDDICKVVIVDDDNEATEQLRQALSLYPDLEIMGSASCGATGRELILDQRPDLLFLDVELPDVLGFNLLDEICDEVTWDMKVVFYTAYDQYLLQALRQSAFDYLLKPFSEEELDGIVSRFRKVMASPQDMSFASTVGGLIPTKNAFMIGTVIGFRLLHMEEIGFFEYTKEKRQWKVTLFDQTKLNLKKHTRAEDIICYSNTFVQISQSIIININYLAIIDGKKCQLCPPFHVFEELTVSRGFLKELQDRFCLI